MHFHLRWIELGSVWTLWDFHRDLPLASLASVSMTFSADLWRVVRASKLTTTSNLATFLSTTTIGVWQAEGKRQECRTRSFCGEPRKRARFGSKASRLLQTFRRSGFKRCLPGGLHSINKSLHSASQVRFWNQL